MQTLFLGHACLKISEGKTSVVIDPYLEKSSWAGQLYVTEPMPLWQNQIKTSDYIIFSHAHDDHYNEGMINANWALFAGKRIIVPKFKARFFPQRLKNIGFEDVTELEEGETLRIGGIELQVLINNTDMDSSWLFKNDKGQKILAQTDNLDLSSLEAFGRDVDLLWYMYGQTGIFPTFLDVPFETKVRLLEKKRNSWYSKIREMIENIKPRFAFGYASDMYYGQVFEANLVEASLKYPPDLQKAAPGLSVDLDAGVVSGTCLQAAEKLQRIYNSLQHDKADRIAFQNKLHIEEIKLTNERQDEIIQNFIANLNNGMVHFSGLIKCKLTIEDLSGSQIYLKDIQLGPTNSENVLNLSLNVPLPFLSLLEKSEVEMGAIALWNGAIRFGRDNIEEMSSLEREFWRSFRRMKYY